ncbi:MAG: hypothetical protein JWP00_877 [Chloroflexi bacterium]|nr:hypothetical protein [Chloroflexota bacterium]
MSEQQDEIKPALSDPRASLNQGARNQGLIAIHDEDIDLGFQLKAADAKSWGRDQAVLKKISNQAALPGAGKGGVSGEPGSGNSGKNYGAASNSGDNSGMHSTGTSGVTGVPTDTGEGTRLTGSAGTESTSANERKQ